MAHARTIIKITVGAVDAISTFWKVVLPGLKSWSSKNAKGADTECDKCELHIDRCCTVAKRRVTNEDEEQEV